jgi:hypothetical protein
MGTSKRHIFCVKVREMKLQSFVTNLQLPSDLLNQDAGKQSGVHMKRRIYIKGWETKKEEGLVDRRLQAHDNLSSVRLYAD